MSARAAQAREGEGGTMLWLLRMNRRLGRRLSKLGNVF